MNVVSFFDGMSCGQIAFERQNIKIDKYFAAETDKYAIKVTQSNYPNTIQIGDVAKVSYKNGVLYTENGEYDVFVDMVIGGSPCQGFSFAGKQLNFEDPRSKLFFEFVRFVNEIKSYNPKIKFLLENVRMKKEYKDVISEYLGVEPVVINSSLVSAQNRVRLYWANWNFDVPKDKGLLLKDVLQNNEFVDDKYYVNTTNTSGLDINKKAPTQRSSTDRCIDEKHNYQIIKLDKKLKEKKNQDKASCLTGGAHSGGNHSDMDIICIAMRGRYNEDGSISQVIEPRGEKTNTLTTVQKDNLILIKDHKSNNGLKCVAGLSKNKKWLDNGKNQQRNFSQGERVYDTSGKSPSLSSNSGGTAGCGNALITDDVTEYKLRRLTPIECERLQTVPDNYTNHVSNTQRYKMLGNGWTVDVISHIFSLLK